MGKKLALHETLETHELLTLKNVSLTKLAMMTPLVQDEELKDIMTVEMDRGNAALERLKVLLGGEGEN